MPFVKVDLEKENEKFKRLLEDREKRKQYEIFEKEYELKKLCQNGKRYH